MKAPGSTDHFADAPGSFAYVYGRSQVGETAARRLIRQKAVPLCPGARMAVDEFFHERPETPIVLPTGQALVIRAPQLEA
jgi:hypothetical protein